MNNKGSVEWRIIWMIIVMATAIVAIAIVVILYYASANSSSPFTYFSGLFGGL